MDTEFRILCALLLACIVSVRAYFYFNISNFGNKPTQAEGMIISRLRKVAMGLTVLLCMAYLFNFQFMADYTINFHNTIRWAGVLSMASAPPLLFWVHHTLGTNFSRTLELRDEHKLITDGPYKRIRHPMYTALALLFFGLFLISENYIIGIVGMATVGLIMLRAKKEEEMMVEHFGEDYKIYCGRTGRILPKF